MATRRKIDWGSLTEEQQWEAAEDVGLQEYTLDCVADLISSGKNVSPRLIAKSLRNLVEVNIPCEILEYAADLLEGKRRRGKPVNTIHGTLNETRHSFTRADFDALVEQGKTADEALRILALEMIEDKDPSEEEIERTVNRLSTWVYPRKRKPRGKHYRD
ncbi:hypothetical protein [Fundidesulfovibrio soli]|uniref:hypothetical protein n=1 Tax=Fundidesulfovibrio soli TaxID=2922716 RepID=UPI001FAFDD95|nr:hypothetical protein [Fundidesulfovibrio soli]